MDSNMSEDGDRDVVKAVAMERKKHIIFFVPRRSSSGLLYHDVLIEILCRLPPKILMRCSCVCKTWYTLMLRHCLPRITPSLPLLGIDISIWISPTNQVVARALVPKQAQPDAVDTPQIDAWLLFENNFCPDANDLVNSCNGLMLFIHRSDKRYILWNPNTNESAYITCPNGKPGVFVALAFETDWNRKGHYFPKIIFFPKAEGGGATKILYVFFAMPFEWVEHKVQYNFPVDNNAITPLKNSVYLHGRLYRIAKPHSLLWYTFKDDYNHDVLCDYIKLPDADPGSNRLGRIGSCAGRLQYAESLKNSGLMRIWVFGVDTSEWTLKHSIGLQTQLVNHPQLVDLQITFPPAKLYKKFMPLAFDPVSDAVVIWTPKRIFIYYYNTGNLVTLECSETYIDALKRPPSVVFPFTRRLMPLSFMISRRVTKKVVAQIAQ